MLNEERARVSRYEAVIALLAVSALFVSGYTAYVQRQQVRAAVWPILEYNTNNDPSISLTLKNKGVGPAIIRYVTVKVDGKPVRNWYDALQILIGPGDHHFTESTMSGHVLSAGETMEILEPHDADNNPLTAAKGGPDWDKMNKARMRISVEICYSSTLGDCWLYRSDGNTSSRTAETRICPNDAATEFEQ